MANCRGAIFLKFNIVKFGKYNHFSFCKIERQSTRMSKIKHDGLDQYDPELFRQEQFGTAGVERVKH